MVGEIVEKNSVEAGKRLGNSHDPASGLGGILLTGFFQHPNNKDDAMLSFLHQLVQRNENGKWFLVRNKKSLLDPKNKYPRSTAKTTIATRTAEFGAVQMQSRNEKTSI